MRICILGAAGSIAFGAMLAGGTANAQLNQLEVKQPQVEADEVEVEYLGEYYPGQPRRRFIEEEPGSFVFDDNDFSRQRHTLGLGYGLTQWLGLELSAEAAEERLDDAETVAAASAFDDLKITEIQIGGTIVLVPAAQQGFGAAALVEHNFALNPDEASQLFLGTALQFAWGAWTATANLYAVKNIGGREELDGAPISDERWDFQYAARIGYRLTPDIALALEGYGVVERLGDSGTMSDERELFGDFDRHLLGPVVYYSWGTDSSRPMARAGKNPRLPRGNASGDNNGDGNNGDTDGPRYTLGAGVLVGLNENTAGVALKWALDVEF